MTTRQFRAHGNYRGGADPPSLSGKWEVFPGEKCPTGVRALSPAKKHCLDRDLTFSLK